MARTREEQEYIGALTLKKGKRKLAPKDICEDRLGDPGEELSDFVKEKWNSMKETFFWLREADRDAMTQYCQTWQQYQMAHAALIQALQSPEAIRKQRQLDTIYKIVDKTGLTLERLYKAIGGLAGVRASRNPNVAPESVRLAQEPIVSDSAIEVDPGSKFLS